MRNPVFAICEQQRRRWASLTSTFVVRSLDSFIFACSIAAHVVLLYNLSFWNKLEKLETSIIPILAKPEISRLWLVYAAEHAGLSLLRPQTPKTGFLVTWLFYEDSFKRANIYYSKFDRDHFLQSR